VTERVEIAAPVDEVFAYFDDVGNAARLIANLVEITKVEPLAGGGRRVEYTTRARDGSPVDASSEHEEYHPPRRTVTRGVQSGVSVRSTRDFAPLDDGRTSVTATVEWSVPVKFVAGLVGLPLRRPLKDGLRHSLTAAKEALEGPVDGIR
jgi:uncharacterized membrane protein